MTKSNSGSLFFLFLHMFLCSCSTLRCVFILAGAAFFWLKSLFIYFLHSGLPGPHMLRSRCVCARWVPLFCGLGRFWVWESTGILHGPVLRSRSFPGRDGHLQLWPQLDRTRLLDRSVLLGMNKNKYLKQREAVLITSGHQNQASSEFLIDQWLHFCSNHCLTWTML